MIVIKKLIKQYHFPNKMKDIIPNFFYKIQRLLKTFNMLFIKFSLNIDRYMHKYYLFCRKNCE